MDCSTPGFPVFYHLLEFAQTHVHSVGNAESSWTQLKWLRIHASLKLSHEQRNQDFHLTVLNVDLRKTIWVHVLFLLLCVLWQGT